MLEYQELMGNVIKGQNSDLYHARKLDLYEKLSENFSMIPLWGNTKKAIDKGWSRYCHEKNVFDKNRYKFNNAGICCGPASKLLVLDVDNPRLFEKMLRDSGVENIPKTFTVKTGMKGYQCYYLLPNDGKQYGVTVIKHDGEKVGELRGVRGYVVAPGSRHPDTGNIYEIVCFDQVNKASEFILGLNKEEVKASNEKRETKYIESVYGEIDLYEMGIPEDTIRQIQYPWPVGERSEKEMSVIFKLLLAGVSEENIHSVFEYCQIGEKHHERGTTRHNILQYEIEKAKVEIEKSKGKCAMNVLECKATKKYRTSLKEILVRDKRLEYLIEGFWPKNETMVIFGAGGTGKSLLTTLIAAEIVTPTENGLFGMFKVGEPGRVLIFQSENGEEAINERNHVSARLLEVAQNNGENIEFVSLGGGEDITISGDIENEDFFKFICEQIEEFKPTAVIFDPLSCFHCKDENDNSGMHRALNRLNIIQQKYKINILIVHHSGKQDSANGRSAGRGASSIHGWCRNAIELKCTDELGGKFKLVHQKANNFKKFGEIELVRDEKLNFVATSCGVKSKNVDSKTATPKKATPEFVLAVLKKLGGKVDKQQELIDKMIGFAPTEGISMSIGKAQPLIQEAIESGSIIEFKGPRNSKGLRVNDGSDIQF
ncbi:AAA family ATPase [Fundidesulfovibrio terrae]|uniref:AAA family ATPase n=1 Tax=Fundidesulfovibrio terrae TaxID=2922866 RepID=UPI001FAF683C|nr:AAA family ATPase [Fundidesulfovibrio terrae]